MEPQPERPGRLDPTLLLLLAHLHCGGDWAYWWVADDARRDARGRAHTRSHWWPTSRPPLPLPHSDTLNLYMGVHPCRVRRGDHQRATIATVAAINCLYAEFDAADPAAKAALLERVTTITPAPSVIVDSGGGYHAYWLLDEPFVLTGEAERERARQAQYAWVAYTGADAAAKDLARVLRVPGTVNRKAAYAPAFPPVAFAPAFPPVAFVQANLERTYALADLEQIAAALAPVHQSSLTDRAEPEPPDDVARAAGALTRLACSRCDAYDAWLHVGMVLHAGLGNAGLALWERWSQQSARYAPGVCAAKWASFGQRPHGYTLASLFYWAEQDDPARTPDADERSRLPHASAVPEPLNDDDPVVAAHLTDLGNARRLVARCGADLRYVAEWGWMIWDGRRWVQDRTGAVMRMAKATVLAIATEAAEAGDEKVAEKIRSWARASEGRGRLEALIALAQSEPGIPAQPEAFDTQDWLLTCRNGTLDLRTGQLGSHRREDLLTRLVDIDYDPATTCPTWMTFLDRVMAGNVALIGYLQRTVGYALTGSTGEQAMFLLYGTGANGKSTFLEALRDLFGDYGRQTDPATFLARAGSDRIPNDIARLAGARFVSAIEVDEGRRLSEVLVKQVISGDTLTARFLNREFFEFRARFKLFLAANHKPVIRGTDEGIWRRIRLIPFTVTIPKAERDRTLPERLRAELPGILAWAVQGCLAWQTDGLADPPDVLAATATYRSDMDVVGAFLDDCCLLALHARADCAALYAAYTKWCEEGGETALSQRRFAQRLEERGLPRLRGAQGRWYRQGIGLRDDGRGDGPPSPPTSPAPEGEPVADAPDPSEPVFAPCPLDLAEPAPDAPLPNVAAGGPDPYTAQRTAHTVRQTGAEPGTAHSATPDCQPGLAEEADEPAMDDQAPRPAQPPPRSTGPPGIDLAYVRRLLALGDPGSLAALERHGTLYRAPPEVVIAQARAHADPTDTLMHYKEDNRD